MTDSNASAPATSVGRALIVSNDPATIHQLTEAMQQFAMFPELAAEVSTALRLLDNRRFEAVIVDLQLGEQVRTVLEQVRLSPANRTAITFAITNTDEETALLFKAGSSFVLKRPLAADSVSRTLKAAYGMIVRERRRYFRCPIEIPASIRRTDMQEVHGQTVNISEGGMALETSGALNPGILKPG